MTPRLVVDDLADVLLSDSEVLGYGDLRLPVEDSLPDGGDVLWGQPGHAMAFPSIVGHHGSALCLAISVVVPNGPEKPVGGVLASGGVAGVADAESVRDRSPMVLVSPAVGTHHARATGRSHRPVPEQTVAGLRRCGRPDPAVVRPTHGHLVQVAVHSRSSLTHNRRP